MTTTIKGSVRSWHHEPGVACFVTIRTDVGEIKLPSTPELVEGCRRGASVKITVEVEPADCCPKCGPLR